MVDDGVGMGGWEVEALRSAGDALGIRGLWEANE